MAFTSNYTYKNNGTQNKPIANTLGNGGIPLLFQVSANATTDGMPIIQQGVVFNKILISGTFNATTDITFIDSEQNITKVVSYQEIKDNDYNLSVSSYVEAQDTREVIDIDQINQKLEDTVERITQLRKDLNSIISEINN